MSGCAQPATRVADNERSIHMGWQCHADEAGMLLTTRH
jgi:hypothetical protein